jgi:hypothetical protein
MPTQGGTNIGGSDMKMDADTIVLIAVAVMSVVLDVLVLISPSSPLKFLIGG